MVFSEVGGRNGGRIYEDIPLFGTETPLIWIISLEIRGYIVQSVLGDYRGILLDFRASLGRGLSFFGRITPTFTAFQSHFSCFPRQNFMGLVFIKFFSKNLYNIVIYGSMFGK